MKVRRCNRQKGCGWQFNLKVSLGVRSQHGDGVWQRWQTNHVKPASAILNRSRNFNAGSGKMLSWKKKKKKKKRFNFHSCIDSGLGCVCALWTNVACKPRKQLLFYYHLNFPLVLLVCIFEWNKLSVSVTWRGGEKKSLNLTSQMRRKEVVKAFWGEMCPWTGCVNDWTGRQEKKLCSTSSQYFESLVLL